MDKIILILSAYEGTLKLLIALAVVVERISEIMITYNEKWFKGFKFEKELTSSVAKQLTTILVSLILAFSVNVILLPEAGLSPIVNKIFAGIVISLGSNVLHDISKMVSEMKNVLKATNELKVLQYEKFEEAE